jgi:hypothetical protein
MSSFLRSLLTWHDICRRACQVPPEVTFAARETHNVLRALAIWRDEDETTIPQTLETELCKHFAEEEVTKW